MPAPPGTSYALTAHITDWTGTNAHAGSDSGNTTITIDNLSPGNVTNATATAGSTQVVLAGTRPADSDLESIVVLRRAGSAVTDTPVEGATYSVGNTVGSSTVACVITSPTNCTDTGLTNGTAYHYKIFAKDTHGNYATGVVPTGSPATPFAGITVTPTSGLTTTEAGGTATFTVVLTSRPVADVTIGLSSSDTTEGTVSPSSLTFTSANWDFPRRSPSPASTMPWTTATSRTRSSPPPRRAPAVTTEWTRATSRSPTPTTTRRVSRSIRLRACPRRKPEARRRSGWC